MGSCYGTFIKILAFFAMLHTCGVVYYGFSVGATVAGWAVVLLLFLLGAVFRWYEYDEEDEAADDSYEALDRPDDFLAKEEDEDGSKDSLKSTELGPWLAARNRNRSQNPKLPVARKPPFPRTKGNFIP